LNAFTLKEIIMADSNPGAKGGRREQQKAETRELILDAARDLFEDRGFEGTTMRAVAGRAGVGLGTIFNHFEDKGALLIAAVLEDLSKTDRQIVEDFPTDAPIRDQILYVAASGYGYWCRRPSLSAELLREMYFIRGPWAETRREETARFLTYVTELLEKAQRRGELRTGFDPRRIAESLYSVYVGNLIRAAGDNRFELDEMLQSTAALLDHLLAGIATAEL
jgi:AcrR family transcriptional regulator